MVDVQSNNTDHHPAPLLGIQRQASIIEMNAASGSYDKELGRLVAELAWHIAILRDRMDDAEIPQLEVG